jgi:hypothetical protein
MVWEAGFSGLREGDRGEAAAERLKAASNKTTIVPI